VRKTKVDLALELMALMGHTTVGEMRSASGWERNVQDAQKISRRYGLKSLAERVKSLREKAYLERSSVWFVSRLRVRVQNGTTPNDACRRMNECLSRALHREYGEDYKGEGVLLIEDPSMVIQVVERPVVPVIKGAAELKY
jgi:hypothetical protein